MFYGAGPKGMLWKVGCFLAAFSVLAIVCAAGNESVSMGGTIGAAFAMIAIGFVFTIPYGIRLRKLTAGGGRLTGGDVAVAGGIGAAIMGNWLLVLSIGVFYLFFKLAVWVGDVIYSSIWKLIALATGRRVVYDDHAAV